MSFKRRVFISLKIICLLFLLTLVVTLLSPLPTFASWSEPRFNKLHNSSVPFKVQANLETKWTSQNLTTIRSSPAVDNEGNIYLSTNLGLTALDKNGVKKWNFIALVNGGPVLDSFNNIYFSGGNCGSFIFSLDKNGIKRWEYDLRGGGGGFCGYNSAGPITLSNDETVLYVGSSYPRSTILAFNLDGTLKWESGLNGQSPFGAPTVASDGTIYVGSGGNSRLFALTEDGVIKWSRFIASGPTVYVSSPVLDPDGNIYVTGQGSTPATFVSLTPLGIERWKYSLPSGISFDAPPAIKDNRVYQVEGNSLRALDRNTGVTIWVWSTPFPTTRALNQPVVDAGNNIYTSVLNQLFIIGEDGQTKNTITLENYLSLLIIPEDDLIYISRNIGTNGYLYALGTKKLTKIPLIFIPGIAGSELKVKNGTNWSKDNGHGGIYTKSYKALEKVWVNEDEARSLGNDDYFDILRLKGDGETDEAELALDGLYEGSYGSTIKFFEASGYILNKDLFVFPYDWRKDLALTKDLLDQKIESIKAQTGASKVDLVAHSMGGLVGRNYIADTTKAPKVQKLITLGTPNLGSVKLVKSLHYGSCLILEFGPFCLALNPQELKDIIQNMPGGYQLAPSQKYFDFYTGGDLYPSPFKDLRDIDSNGVTGQLNYNQIKDLLTNLGHNTSLFSKAEAFHTLDNNLANTNSVETTLIVGSGIATLGQIIEKYKFNFGGIKIPQKDELKINGDDTVPLFSASLDDPSRNLSLKGSARVYYTKQSHGNLVTDGPALELVKNILKNESSIPEKIATTAYTLNGKQLSVHSPVNLHVYDSLGNHTGVLGSGDFEAQIPGSLYETLDDAKFIFLPEDGVYQIKFEATDNGSFDFKIKDYKDNENTSTILYKNIPLTSSTTGEAQLDTNSETPPTLLIDQNEISPTSVLLGDAVLDTTPPKSEIILNGIKGSSSFYKSDVNLEIKAIDDISGVLKVEYSLDNGLTTNDYSLPISFSKEGTHKLKYRAIDKAGNEEAPKEVEIKIDKSAPEAKIQFNLETKNIEITGIDNLTQTNVTENNGEVILSDEAGNNTTLIVNPKDNKKKERLEIKSIRYNEDSLIELPKNLFIVSSHFDKNNQLKNLVQSILIKNQEIVAAVYHLQKDKTVITNRKLKDRSKLLEKNGVILLNLVTNKGILEAGY